MSALAEELLFRGLLQPRIGLVAVSLVFGLLHLPNTRGRLPWPIMAVVMGFVFGGLFEWRGNLVVPVTAFALQLGRVRRGERSRLAGLARFVGWSLTPALAFLGALAALVGLEEALGVALIGDALARGLLPLGALSVVIAAVGALLFTLLTWRAPRAGTR